MKLELSELENIISKQTQLPPEGVKVFIAQLFREIEDELLLNSKVEVKGLGIFRIIKTSDAHRILFLANFNKTQKDQTRNTETESQVEEVTLPKKEEIVEEKTTAEEEKIVHRSDASIEEIPTKPLGLKQKLSNLFAPKRPKEEEVEVETPQEEVAATIIDTPPAYAPQKAEIPPVYSPKQEDKPQQEAKPQQKEKESTKTTSAVLVDPIFRPTRIRAFAQPIVPEQDEPQADLGSNAPTIINEDQLIQPARIKAFGTPILAEDDEKKDDHSPYMPQLKTIELGKISNPTFEPIPKEEPKIEANLLDKETTAHINQDHLPTKEELISAIKEEHRKYLPKIEEVPNLPQETLEEAIVPEPEAVENTVEEPIAEHIEEETIPTEKEEIAVTEEETNEKDIPKIEEEQTSDEVPNLPQETLEEAIVPEPEAVENAEEEPIAEHIEEEPIPTEKEEIAVTEEETNEKDLPKIEEEQTSEEVPNLPQETLEEAIAPEPEAVENAVEEPIAEHIEEEAIAAIEPKPRKFLLLKKKDIQPESTSEEKEDIADETIDHLDENTPLKEETIGEDEDVTSEKDKSGSFLKSFKSLFGKKAVEKIESVPVPETAVQEDDAYLTKEDEQVDQDQEYKEENEEEIKLRSEGGFFENPILEHEPEPSTEEESEETTDLESPQIEEPETDIEPEPIQERLADELQEETKEEETTIEPKLAENSIIEPCLDENSEKTIHESVESENIASPKEEELSDKQKYPTLSMLENEMYATVNKSNMYNTGSQEEPQQEQDEFADYEEEQPKVKKNTLLKVIFGILLVVLLSVLANHFLKSKHGGKNIPQIENSLDNKGTGNPPYTILDNQSEDVIVVRTNTATDLLSISEGYYGKSEYWSFIFKNNPKITNPLSLASGVIMSLPKLEVNDSTLREAKILSDSILAQREVGSKSLTDTIQ